MENRKIISNLTFGDKWGKTTIKVKDFLADKKSPREILKGVYYSNGDIVASNAYVMVVLKGEYPKCNEGKIIAPNSTAEIDTDRKYPPYRLVIDRAKKDSAVIILPSSLIEKMIGEIKGCAKSKLFTVRLSCFDKRAGFRLNELLKMLHIAKMCVSPTVYLHKDDYAMRIEAEGLFAMLSATHLEDDRYRNAELYDVNADTCEITYNEKATPLDVKH